MAKRKKASWVGAANPADPETGVLKPRTEMNAEQSAEAAKIDPAPKLVSKPLPVQGQKVYKAPVQKRTQKKAAPLIVDAKEVRAPKNSELRRGVTSVSTAPKKKRVKKQTPVAVPKQATLVCELMLVVIADAGCVIVAELVAKHPLASVTVTI